MPEDWQAAGFGLYLHWPFCQAKCPYCDFNSHVVSAIDQRRWADAYVKEIDRVGALTSGRVLRSVFFGGGTPSLMDAAVVQAILDRVRATWTLANDCEITLEANPTSVEADRFAAYRDAGVNRVSLGVQALNDADLKALGRLHSADEAMRAYALARDVFDRVSFDLIYARQHQSLTDWSDELRRALDLAVDHLSLYQLTIEDGTAFGARFAQGGLRGLPDDDLAADMYFATQELCAAAGLPAYEVSNHALPGAESRHNLIYWMSGDYAGIGPGAHGRLTLDGVRYATETPLSPTRWLAAAEQGKGQESREVLDVDARLSEFALMGLRVHDGIDLARFRALGGDRYISNINILSRTGQIELGAHTAAVSPAYRPVLNAVLRDVLAD